MPLPLPTEMMEEEPVYVNAKQYHRIMMRRQARQKMEQANRLPRQRKVADVFCVLPWVGFLVNSSSFLVLPILIFADTAGLFTRISA